MKKKLRIVAALAAGLFSVTSMLAASCPMQCAAAAESQKIMDALTEVHDNTIWMFEFAEEYPLKPGEYSSDGSMLYVAEKHIQELNGLLLRCSDLDALDSVSVGESTIDITDYTTAVPYDPNSAYHISRLSDYYTNYYDLLERINGEYTEQDHASVRQLMNEDVCILKMDYGSNHVAEEQAIVDYLTAEKSVEVIGILQTDWYVKGFYDDWNPTLIVKPAEGKEVDAEALNTAEYCHLRYSNLNDYARVIDDGLSNEEIIALCEKLEARDDISYAWIVGEYLADPMANKSSHVSTVDLFGVTICDVNGNGQIELVDALAALQAYSDTMLMDLPNPLTAEQTFAADIDGNGKITMEDALAILQTYTEVLFRNAGG